MEDTPPLNRNRRFYELDLLRFVAAVEVMLFHYTLRGFPHGYHPVDFTALSDHLRYFYFGLELLFVLSGFVILKTVQGKTALGFLSARAVRLYPTYWVCVTLSAVALWVGNYSRASVHPAQYVANLTMIQSVFGYESVDGVYWTMEVQLLFYAWVFLVCLVKQIHNADKFLGLWLLASLFFHAFGGITFTKLDYLLLPKLSHFFIAGGAFFLIYQRRSSFYLWSVVVVCYVTAIKLVLDSQVYHPAAIVGDTLIFLLFGHIALHDHRLSGKPWMIKLFKMTYPLYLIHQYVGYLLLSKLSGYMPKYLLLVVVVSVMLVASYVIATQVDKWIMPWVKKAADRLLGSAGKPSPRPQVELAPPRVPVSVAEQGD
jgi:peptidoglycan/LPS O-acetylase OafA/YrhL